jgi:flagellum-specific ATP synthase
MNDFASPEHMAAARRFRQLYATYRRNEDLVRVGAYAPGSDAEIDTAIAAWPVIQRFLSQDLTENVTFDDALHELRALTGGHLAGNVSRGDDGGAGP